LCRIGAAIAYSSIEMSDVSDADARFRRGAVLRGKYRIDRVLGEGGMGVVLLATHLKLDQRVAIKVLSPAIQKRPHLQARFAREARAASKLRNEHVVRVLDVDETEDGLPFLVMELLVGMDLDALLRREGPLTAARAAEYVLQACEGVAEAHAVGIIHRDLKPANLFLAKGEDSAERVKILDFGIAKAVESEDDLSLTETNGVVGSPLYMSPEQLKGSRELDARTDVWSLGVVLYQLATGKLPFEATSATALAACIASEPPVDIASLRPDLPPAYVTAVERCLRKVPSERFASVVELARAIADLAPGDAGAAARVSRVSRAAAVRRLSLAATQAEEEDAVVDAAPARPARVTAALSAEASSESAADPPGEPTDYGSEVARKPSVPAPPHVRRTAALGQYIAAAGAVVVVVLGVVAWMRSDTGSTSRERSTGSALPPASTASPNTDTPEAAAPASTTLASAATAVVPVTSSPAPTATTAASGAASSVPRAGSARAPGGAAASPVKTSPAPSGSVSRPSSTGSPLDIDLK
jgi:hypothetical protein